MPQSSAELRPSGLPYALGAHLIWGLMPLYLRQVHSVPVLEFVGWRVIFTLPCALLFIALRGQGSELRVALGNRRILLRLLISAVFVASNWLIYVLAIQSGQVLAASFGYYVTPLLQVGVGALAWSNEIGAYAQAWAEHLAGNGCQLAHHSGGKPYGENLFWGSQPSTAAAVVTQWAAERSAYDHATGACSGTCGHYTQLVWSKSTLSIISPPPWYGYIDSSHSRLP